jgi:hypothetical protein
VEKKTLLTGAFITMLLLSAVAGIQFVSLGKANPFIRDYVAPDSYTKPPKISIYSPKNSTLCSNSIELSINVSLPESQTASMTFLHTVYYETDWLENRTYLYNSMGLSDEIRSDNPPERQCFLFSGIFTVPEGKHSLVIHAEGGGWYPPEGIRQNGFFIDGAQTVFFTSDATPPIVSVLLLENKTYYISNMTLNFTSNELVSQASYSLDGQENVTIAGNTTLTNLPVGKHNVTVYATDNAGNTGTSETLFFTVKETEPYTVVPLAVSVTTVAVVVAGLLVYFKKRKR